MDTVSTNKKRNLIIAAIIAMILAAVIAGAAFLQSALLPDGASSDAIADLMPGDVQDPLIGQQAPDFTFTDEQGTELRLSDFAGTPVVLNFWASWCPPCRIEKPEFQQAYEQYGNEVKFIMLNADESVEVARAYTDEEGYTFPVYFDTAGEGAFAFEVTGIPETFIINTDGAIVARFLGATGFTTLQRAIQNMH